jgi:hypothetical protein
MAVARSADALAHADKAAANLAKIAAAQDKLSKATFIETPWSATSAGLALFVFTDYLMDQELAEKILKTLELILFVAIWNSWVLKDYLVKPLFRLLLWCSARLRRTRAKCVFGVPAHLYALTFILLWGLTGCVLSLWSVGKRHFPLK